MMSPFAAAAAAVSASLRATAFSTSFCQFAFRLRADWRFCCRATPRRTMQSLAYRCRYARALLIPASAMPFCAMLMPAAAADMLPRVTPTRCARRATRLLSARRIRRCRAQNAVVARHAARLSPDLRDYYMIIPLAARKDADVFSARCCYATIAHGAPSSREPCASACVRVSRRFDDRFYCRQRGAATPLVRCALAFRRRAMPPPLRAQRLHVPRFYAAGDTLPVFATCPPAAEWRETARHARRQLEVSVVSFSLPPDIGCSSSRRAPPTPAGAEVARRRDEERMI